MTDKADWSEWRTRHRKVASPYVDWEMGLYENMDVLDDMVMVPAAQTLETAAQLKRRIADFSESAFDTDPTSYLGDTSSTLQDPASALAESETLKGVFPVPGAIANPDFVSVAAEGDDGYWLGGDGERPKLHENTVTVGVIDIDVGFGHRRFRRKDGSTRVLASWQQGVEWNSANTSHRPFGEVLWEKDINAMLSACSCGNPTKPLDQEAFYQKAGLIRKDGRSGMGGLAKTYAHGTHVMGLAAGADPFTDETGVAENVRLLVVNLPPPSFYGEGGAFLDYYLSYGLIWIAAVHRQLARALENKAPNLFVNVSFGKQAGPGDSRQVFGSDAMAAAAPIIGTNPETSTNVGMTIVLPTGNDNLERCHAHIHLHEDVAELEWRIQPEDQTSNFLEIWVRDEFDLDAVEAAEKTGLPLLIDVVLPDGTHGSFDQAGPLSVRDLRTRSGRKCLGRIYCDWVKASGLDEGKYRLRYLVCLAPNARPIGASVPPPAGQYKVRLKNGTEDELCVRAQVQTDEAILPGTQNAKRSYLEHSDYRRHEWEGREADTYVYEAGADNKKDLDRYSHVRRHGTMNAYATYRDVTAIGGFRLADGRPAAYSGTGLGYRDHENGRGAPTAAFPSDDGYAHFGILSDGAQDGSRVAMRGTSFACAAATRFLAEAAVRAKLNGSAMGHVSELLKVSTGNNRPYSSWTNNEADIEKVGWGRVCFTPHGPIRRM